MNAISTLPTTPALVAGHVSHTRLEKMTRKFRHSTYQWLVDLDQIPVYPWYLRAFTGFSSKDHLGQPELSIRRNVEHFLEISNLGDQLPARILMLANARILGYTFDPLTVFWCLDREENVLYILAEVRNTYGQRHVYLVRPNSSGRAEVQKQFHVSPFMDVSGDYKMRFTLTPESISTSITLMKNEETAFTAAFIGHPVPATVPKVISQIISNPFITQRTTAMIRIHGIWLWLKRLPIFPLPPHDRQEGV